jgi:hypothetical protein
LTVRYNTIGSDAGLPTALFTKTSPRWTSRLIVGLLGAMDSETTFYNVIRPQLNIEAPHGYHAVFDRASARTMMILEDVATTRGAQFGDPARMRIDHTRATSMVTQMATYHAAFWDSPRLRAAELTWMPTSLAWQQRANAAINFPGRSRIGLKRAAGLVPEQSCAGATRSTRH